MSTSDILKAALEKKKQLNQQTGKTKTKGADKAVHGNQVTTNRPQKKAAGRGG
jgi:hypothetical protein